MLAALLTLFLFMQIDPPLQTTSLSQRAPLVLETLSAELIADEVVVSGIVTSDTEDAVAAFAVGWLLIDPFDDLVSVSYRREYGGLGSGDSADLRAHLTDARADEVAEVVGFVYAVRFVDGELWKADFVRSGGGNCSRTTASPYPPHGCSLDPTLYSLSATPCACSGVW